jgi:hypothetical protein
MSALDDIFTQVTNLTLTKDQGIAAILTNPDALSDFVARVGQRPETMTSAQVNAVFQDT